jgi:hypothetical protein
MASLQLNSQAPRKERHPVKPLHLFLAALAGSALLAAPAFAQGEGESRLDPQPPPPATAPPPVPLPPFIPPPPAGKAGLAEALVSDPPAQRVNPPLYHGWLYPVPLAFPVYPVEMTQALWVRQDGGVAHDMTGGIPAPPIQHKVILRDGVTLLARGAPRLAGGSVRFSDPRGMLVSVRASDVDLPATAAANALDWHGAAPAPKKPAPAASPGAPPR